ncbi:MAG: carbamoyltransferase HypF [Candidatus Dadabacteria bacterium]|nr:carbamoyltransferase HypF [Candidatus Dadabacteria bacterium]NIQ13955.1 carbamoyltransferase HypF [Candidatus Dadabacteria bacterium]
MDYTYSRLELKISGVVQGVGFRPFIFRLASKLGLSGWVSNSTEGVVVEIEGRKEDLQNFIEYLHTEKPIHCVIDNIKKSELSPVGDEVFEIKSSISLQKKNTFILPDIATCKGCLDEISDPENRRYLYPFTTCTECGPRFSIIEKLPFDRTNTTMKKFEMCDECFSEYENPGDRRFHSQTNACPTCGPRVQLLDNKGDSLCFGSFAIDKAVESLKNSGILAIKGIGGFHFFADAKNIDSVTRLRKLKGRGEKPFAVMYPNSELVNIDCDLSSEERKLLCSPESPIVLLRKTSDYICGEVAPGNPYLGVMLPYTPLHHILINKLNTPVVATSGNLSGEPITIDEKNAVKRLGSIADHFLVHNRAIVRHVDDSVVRVINHNPMVVRLGRGYAPLSIKLKKPIKRYFALGGHLKNSIAFSIDDTAVLSQHIGDLETMESLNAFESEINVYNKLYDFVPNSFICDKHPAYLSTQYAERQNVPTFKVQHHYAHILSCKGEWGIDEPVLGVSWDGSGYGIDATIWGGEFLKVSGGSFKRVAHFRSFSLPGGKKSIEEPRRTSLGLLYEIYKDTLFDMKHLTPLNSFSAKECDLLRTALEGKINSPTTTSVGRIFDAVSSILDLCHFSTYEGQAAMALEFTINGVQTDDIYELNIKTFTENGNSSIIVDWEPMIKEILEEVKNKSSKSLISAKFHNTLVESILLVANRSNEKKIVLSGGCFQNKYLIERACKHLRKEGFLPYWNRRVPSNDGGISFGQIVAASYLSK